MGPSRKLDILGYRAALAAATAIAAGVRAAHEGFAAPPEVARRNPPADAFARALDETDRVHRALASETDGPGEYPAALEAAIREIEPWHRSTFGSSTTFGCKPVYGEVLLLARSALGLWLARAADDGETRMRAMHLSVVWSQIGGLMRHRDHPLVVTLGNDYGNGVRERAETLLRDAGTTGGWFLSTNTDDRERWFLLRHVGPNLRPQPLSYPIPRGFFADAILDRTTRRYVLPDERP